MDSPIVFCSNESINFIQMTLCPPTYPGSSSPKTLLQSHCNNSKAQSNDPASVWKQKYQRPFIKDDALLSDRALLSCHFFGWGKGTIYIQRSILSKNFFICFNQRLTPDYCPTSWWWSWHTPLRKGSQKTWINVLIFFLGKFLWLCYKVDVAIKSYAISL